MSSFVLVFRQGNRRLDAEETAARDAATRAWAAQRNAAGHALEPRILGEEGWALGHEGGGAPREPRVTALLFLEARDLAEAIEIARSHPGVRYGAAVEVRPWAPPRRPTP